MRGRMQKQQLLLWFLMPTDLKTIFFASPGVSNKKGFLIMVLRPTDLDWDCLVRRGDWEETILVSLKYALRVPPAETRLTVYRRLRVWFLEDVRTDVKVLIVSRSELYFCQEFEKLIKKRQELLVFIQKKCFLRTISSRTLIPT